MPGFSQDSVNSPYSVAILDDPLSFEYVQDFSGGEDSFRRSTLIDPNQCQHLLNIIVRDNYEARTRPGVDAIPTQSVPPINGATSVYALRYFQANISGVNVEQLLASVAVGGTPHILDYDGAAWHDIALPVGFPSAADDRVAMAVGVDTVLMSDGVGEGQIWNGSTFTATGAPGNLNFPVGCTILCWFTQRMFAAGLSTAPDTIYLSDFLDFTAGHWNATTRSFRIGGGDGDPIVSLAPMQGNTLAVLKTNSVWLLTADPALDNGTNTVATFTAQQVITSGIGCVGRDAWCNYGNDVLFMAQDGVRSVQRMQAAAGQWQLTSPISQPIQPYIQRINQGAWDKIVAIKYQEFAFFFVPLDNSTTNNYCLSYNGRLQKWMGAWTNWNANCVELTRFNGTQHFVFGDSAGLVNQWKDLSSDTDDATYTDNGIGYSTEVWTRSFQFQEAVNNKTAYNTVLRFSAGNAALSLGWYADLALAKTWNGQFSPTGDILGVGTLPFLLASTEPVKLIKGIRGLAAFNEAYVSIQSQQGWFWLRNITASAFINAYKEMS